MKKLLLAVTSVCVIFLLSGFSYPDEKIEEIDSLQRFITVKFNKEMGNAITNKYGSNWSYHPDMICEKSGENLTIEGELLQNEKARRLLINLVMLKSGYKVTQITELT